MLRPSLPGPPPAAESAGIPASTIAAVANFSSPIPGYPRNTPMTAHGVHISKTSPPESPGRTQPTWPCPLQRAVTKPVTFELPESLPVGLNRATARAVMT